jgi:integrase
VVEYPADHIADVRNGLHGKTSLQLRSYKILDVIAGDIPETLPADRGKHVQLQHVFVMGFPGGLFEPDHIRLFTKAVVQEYRVVLERKGLAPSSINVCLAAIRKFALEACDNGLLAPEIASAISRVKGAKQSGVRLGQWLDAPQSEQLLRAPDVSTTKGRRDAAILAVLVGGGLRRSEVAAVTFEHIQRREERWVIADLRGKGGRIRTVPIPLWVYACIESWATIASLRHGRIFRALDKRGRVRSDRLSAQAVFTILKAYASGLGLSVAPHDMRRTWARLARNGDAPLEQIQLSLGHASVVTTELYLGVRQNLKDAPCDRLGLTPPPVGEDFDCSAK